MVFTDHILIIDKTGQRPNYFRLYRQTNRNRITMILRALSEAALADNPWTQLGRVRNRGRNSVTMSYFLILETQIV